MKNNVLAIVSAGVLAVGAAYVLGSQIANIRLADRVVTVRGAAEMPVLADIGTWNLGLSASGDDLKSTQAELAASVKALKAFLTGQGIPAADIENQSLSVADARANQYNQNGGPRFTISGGMVVRTAQLEALQKAKNNLGDVLAKGVILTNSWGPNYAYTKLNDDKPQLVSEATAAAKTSAAQFAHDSGMKLGGIRHASQGSVQILGRDGFTGEAEQINKVLRVVTTVDYDLR